MKNNNTYKKKFTLYPILVVGFFVSLFLFFNHRLQHQGVSATRDALKTYMEKGHVSKIVLVSNKNYVKIFIKEKAFRKQLHQELREHSGGTYEAEKAYYSMEIPSKEIFHNTFQSIYYTVPGSCQQWYITEKESDVFGNLAGWMMQLLIFVLFLLLLLRFFSRGLMDNTSSGGGIFGIGKSKAVLWGEERKVGVTFKDVAGMVEEKAEVREIIDCLKRPEQAKSLGGKIPKGVLLVGPPGTGKTLLAKAVAGEAGVPFFSVSGSDFVELFVGVGASRVADLFNEARKNEKCIVFIDEIDAIGGSRNSRKLGGSNEERENTLNKLLTEMDGFNSEDNIVIIGATNRVEILDPALLRPGRFDRHITIGLPGIKDREEIFRTHITKPDKGKEKKPLKEGEKPLKVVKGLSYAQLAKQTPGFSGAEIANTCNEAALLAARKGKKHIDMQDFQSAMERVTVGLEKRSRVISPQEKKIVAWHEAGHAVAAWFLEHASPLVKVSIIPRGPSALGYAQYLPKELAIYQESQLYDSICVLLAARVAEEIVFGQISTGAADDLKRSTSIAYNMIKKFGMDKGIGHVAFDDVEEYALTAPYSNATGEKIDAGVQKIIEKQYQRAKTILKSRKKELKAIAEALLSREVLFTKDVEQLIGKRPFEEKKESKEDKVSKPRSKVSSEPKVPRK